MLQSVLGLVLDSVAVLQGCSLSRVARVVPRRGKLQQAQKEQQVERRKQWEGPGLGEGLGQGPGQGLEQGQRQRQGQGQRLRAGEQLQERLPVVVQSCVCV